MARVSIIGTGKMGQAIAGVVGKGGHTVQMIAERGDSLAGVVTSGGLKAIDAGALSRARELEAIGFLQITLAAAEKVAWTGGFGVAA